MADEAPHPPPPGAGVRIAIVLGAGGARGLAHVGVLEVLRERGYEVAGIAGVSMGAVVGAVHAAGRLDAFRDWTSSLGRRQVLRLVDLAFGFPGLIRGDRVIGQLRDIVGDLTIESLPVPFVAVATDIERMREVWLTRGDLFDAVRASMAMSPTIDRSRPITRSPRISPGNPNATSTSRSTCRRPSDVVQSRNSSSRPAACTAPTTAPIDTPAMPATS